MAGLRMLPATWAFPSKRLIMRADAASIAFDSKGCGRPDQKDSACCLLSSGKTDDIDPCQYDGARHWFTCNLRSGSHYCLDSTDRNIWAINFSIKALLVYPRFIWRNGYKNNFIRSWRGTTTLEAKTTRCFLALRYPVWKGQFHYWLYKRILMKLVQSASHNVKIA